MKKIILGAILLISLIFLGGCAENLSGDATNIKPRIINANACRADDTCEANVLQAEDVFVKDGLDVDGISQLRGDLYLHDLDVNTTAFLCIDTNNKVYRSYEPCR